MNTASSPCLCVVGDTHGHLQLALCMAARWQEELGLGFDAVLLCGDVGTFTEASQLDNATRRHARNNPCELEFLHQWAAVPQPEWIQKIFRPPAQDGCGLECPVVMVHGNHEGFTHLERLIPSHFPNEPIAITSLPAVDSGGHVRYLPSGWRCVTPAGLVIGGVGGIERGQRRAKYHELAYVNDEAVLHLLNGPKFDILLTHQGPTTTQGEAGSATLQLLLDARMARVWFHGHSIPNRAIFPAGASGTTSVVPLADAAFHGKGPDAGFPGDKAWARVQWGREIVVERTRPSVWREFHRRRWLPLLNGQLVCPRLL